MLFKPTKISYLWKYFHSKITLLYLPHKNKRYWVSFWYLVTTHHMTILKERNHEIETAKTNKCNIFVRFLLPHLFSWNFVKIRELKWEDINKRIWRFSWLWILTSLKPSKLSQTFVPLMRDTCRSDVSPPKMTKTFWAPSRRGNDLLSTEDFDLLGIWLDMPLTEARFGNRKQAWWTMLLRMFVWEKPTWIA